MLQKATRPTATKPSSNQSIAIPSQATNERPEDGHELPTRFRAPFPSPFAAEKLQIEKALLLTMLELGRQQWEYTILN